MVVFRDLKGLMEVIIIWEDKLTDYYDAAEKIIENKQFKQVIALLREKHLNNLLIIKEIHVEDYGKDEWIQITPDCNVKDLLPVDEIKKDSTSQEIIDHVLEFEEKMMDFYSCISKMIISRDEKELFDSLVKFKERQILNIKRFTEM